MESDGSGLGYVQPIREALDFVRLAIGAARDAKEFIDDADQKEAIEKKLDEAERSSQLAEAQMAQGLGYKMCQCTFPPQIKRMIGTYPDSDIRQFECPACGDKDPSDRHCKSRIDPNRGSARVFRV